MKTVFDSDEYINIYIFFNLLYGAGITEGTSCWLIHKILYTLYSNTTAVVYLVCHFMVYSIFDIVGRRHSNLCNICV